MKLLNQLLFAGLLGRGVLATDPLTPDAAEADIRQDELQNILWNLNKIAKDNGGNRAFGTPGYQASVDFVLERAVKRFGKHMTTKVQPFNMTYEETRSMSLTGPDGQPVEVSVFRYNTATPLPGGVTGELIDTPVDDKRGSACFEDQWEGIDATGKIALIKRGLCGASNKVKLAKAHGAVAVIMYNETPGKDTQSTNLRAVNVGKLVPVGGITLDIGTDWKERLGNGEKLSVNLVVDSFFEPRETWNIISETKEGDPNNVVMLGAHLDSVQAGAGINDDGSGTAALLQIMGSFKKYKGFRNKVRFAWWGAEETGLVGSLYYGSQLSESEADKIRFYFNYDMIGSRFPKYTVYSNNEAHKVGAEILFKYLQDKGYPAFYAPFGTSSDYVAFLNLGIPSSGLFTGAGSPYDLCYHRPCDDLDNIEWDTMTALTKAAARVAAQFANSLEGVPRRQKTSANPNSRREAGRRMQRWADAMNESDKPHSCADDDGSSII